LPGERKILIYIIDDDASVCDSLNMLFNSAGMEVQIFDRAEDFLSSKVKEERSCIIADMKMKGLSGLDFQKQLAEKDIKIPVIFLTAFDTNENRQQAKRSGAVGYFRKPVDDQALLDTIKWALSGDSTTKRIN
jgi:FixJ family two-component response regulator